MQTPRPENVGSRPFFAHSLEGRPPDDWQRLEDHLLGVAERAADFADAFGGADWARLAGLWHDLGKYSDEFQNYLLRENGLEAHLELGRGKVNHSSAGGFWALDKLGEARARILAFCILGHHAGLTDFAPEHEGTSCLQERLKAEARPRIPRFETNVPEGIGSAAPPQSRPSTDPALWIRMIFSCLVDADFLDTETFMDPARARARPDAAPSMAELDKLLTSYLDDLTAQAEPTPVNRLRKEVLDQCRADGDAPPGIRTLTVPTGGGKTLSSLAFALRHAARHGLRRVIYVIPYTSIIEQTADVFRKVPGFNEGFVLEHHSNLDPDDPVRDTPRSRLAAENWDAPIIVTTAVQFFESLFAARPSACRKLHRIARSVVIFDEAQTLPVPFLQPCVLAIRYLAQGYGVTPVLCTATQPALGSDEEGLRDGIEGREIMANPARLLTALRRVSRRLHPAWPEPVAWGELAAELAAHPRVLCIVHRKEDARILHRLLPEGTFHLSTRMCGAHRSEKLREIREALEDPGREVRVVSTQLVEAGVDLDFPTVYRAVAGLDSLAQAAGRCNREGRLESGEFVVFMPDSRPPKSLASAFDLGRGMLTLEAEDPLALDRFQTYFRKLFCARGPDGLDAKGIRGLLNHRQGKYAFATAAKRFRLIDDEWRKPVVVAHGPAMEILDQRIEGWGSPRELYRKLQRYTVQIPQRDHQRLIDSGNFEAVDVFPEIFRQVDASLYSEHVGLLYPEEASESGGLSTLNY